MRKVIFLTAAFFALPAVTPAAAVVEMESHRAVYDINLDTVSATSSIRSANGRADYSLQRDCDGWSTTEDYLVSFGHQNGHIDFLSRYVAWESDDGNSYSYSISENSAGEGLQEFTGYAYKSGGGGEDAEAFFIEGEQDATPLPDGTVFPIAYIRELLGDAADGGKIVPAVLFFGGDEGDAFYNVTSVIGLRQPDGGAARLGGLSQDGYWPLRIAYFKHGSDDATPSYEIEFKIQDNGVIRSYLVDYGDFSMLASLREIEALAGGDC